MERFASAERTPSGGEPGDHRQCTQSRESVGPCREPLRQEAHERETDQRLARFGESAQVEQPLVRIVGAAESPAFREYRVGEEARSGADERREQYGSSEG